VQEALSMHGAILQESSQRFDLHQLFKESLVEIEKLKSASRVRWRMEIDPIGD